MYRDAHKTFFYICYICLFYFPWLNFPPPPQPRNIQLYVCGEISSLTAIMANKMLAAWGASTIYHHDTVSPPA